MTIGTDWSKALFSMHF